MLKSLKILKNSDLEPQIQAALRGLVERVPFLNPASLKHTWEALVKFHDDLVVVGGLAVHYHTRDEKNSRFPTTSTLDVDFGVGCQVDSECHRSGSCHGFPEREARFHDSVCHGRSVIGGSPFPMALAGGDESRGEHVSSMASTLTERRLIQALHPQNAAARL